MTVSAARFLGPVEDGYALEVRVPEHTDPQEWLVIIDQLPLASVALIKDAPTVPVEGAR